MQEHHAQVGKSATLELFATYANQYVVQYVTKSTIMAAHMDGPPLGVLHALFYLDRLFFGGCRAGGQRRAAALKRCSRQYYLR